MNAVVTICIGNNYKEIFELTKPTIEAYAKKINADFICIDKQMVSQTSPHFEKFQIYYLLEKYDRIIYIDADAIVREDCPNLLEIVPENAIAMFNEGRFVNRLQVLIESSKHYNVEINERNINKYKDKYYNTGVMVIPRRYKELFKKPAVEDIYNHYEQSYLNHIIIRDDITIYELHHDFNRMAMIDELTGLYRLNSYIIHYAGVQQNLTKIIKQDLDGWRSGIQSIPRHVVLAVGARLGDIVSAEPIIRYMVNNEYQDSRITIVSTEPRIFAHLANKAEIVHFDEHKNNSGIMPLTHNCMLPQEHNIWKYITANAMHTVDFMSIVCLKHTIPDKDKEIKLSVSLSGISQVIEILGSNINIWQQLVLIHPGKNWPSKTFPSEYWQNITKQLLDSGYKIGIIGKEIDNEVGTVPFDVPEGAIDLRDLFDIDGLIALISKAPVLISNDSSPIHIAGAFDNWIILLPTCKHPDHVLPYRNGGHRHKSLALYKKLMCEDPLMNPNTLYGYGLKNIPPQHNINEYIPDVELILNAIKEIFPCPTQS